MRLLASISAILGICLLAVAISGCTADDHALTGPSSTVETVPIGPRDLTLTDSTGAVAGVVTDEQLAPLAGVTVLLESVSRPAPSTLLGIDGIDASSSQALTDDAGEFTVGPVEAGEYALYVYREGYTSKARHVTIVAQETTRLQFSLEPLPSLDPYSDTEMRAGRWQIAFREASFCVAELGTYLPCTLTQRFDIKENWNASIVEVAWRSTSTFATKAVSVLVQGNQTSVDYCAGSPSGLNPMRAEIRPATELPGFKECGDGKVLPESAFTMILDFFPDDGGNPNDLALTFDQPYTIWLSTFYLEAPPAEYSARPEG
jgi:hypothetical protein